jgi:hypothetical protein
MEPCTLGRTFGRILVIRKTIGTLARSSFCTCHRLSPFANTNFRHQNNHNSDRTGKPLSLQACAFSFPKPVPVVVELEVRQHRLLELLRRRYILEARLLLRCSGMPNKRQYRTSLLGT